LPFLPRLHRCCVFSNAAFLLPNFPVPQFIDALLSVPFSDAVFTFYRFSTSLLFSLLPYLPLRIFPLLKFPIGVFFRVYIGVDFYLFSAFFLPNFRVAHFSVAFFCCRFCLSPLLLPFFYIAVIRFVALFTSPDFSVA